MNSVKEHYYPKKNVRLRKLCLYTPSPSLISPLPSTHLRHHEVLEN